jgi:hypothetical protein
MRPWLLSGLIVSALLDGTQAAEPAFRAGAAVVDVSPPNLPVIINGGFLEKSTDVVHDPLHARALALDDGTTRLAIVVVDSCMLPRELIDRAKDLAHDRTNLPVDRMLVSATHTHSAPSAMGALGSRPDPAYIAFLPGRIAEAIAQAVGNLVPAQIGWGVVEDDARTHCRRWIRRPDKILSDPFGERTVRANMHPGHESPDVVGPSGPVDPALSVLAIHTAAGKPLAVLANYSMHYFGAPAVSADYYGRFADRLAASIARERGSAPSVVMMSQGTSGDQQWMDYARPRDTITIDDYASGVAERAMAAYRSIGFTTWVPLAMAESRLKLRRRVPDEARLDWARSIVKAMGDRVPKNQQEVYAREALYLHEEPERELKLQAIRIGALGVAAIPDEVFALTGLRLKAQSPLQSTFVIELANGSEGYIPPPAQHALGGYTTWPARTAALEVDAEPRIAASVLSLLEAVSGRPRRPLEEPLDAYDRLVLDAKPLAYWRLNQMVGDEAADTTANGYTARYAGRLAYYLDGPPVVHRDGPVRRRAVHFAGGRVDAAVPLSVTGCSVEFWFWNGLPDSARDTPAELVVVGKDRITLGGARTPGRLGFAGAATATPLALKTWHHVVLVREGPRATIFVDGRPELAIDNAGPLPRAEQTSLALGGGADPAKSFEGKLAAIAVYDRRLTDAEIADHARTENPGR